MSKTPLPRIAVLGAGPIGLEAALYARSLDLPVTVFEQTSIANFVERWGFVRMFTPFGMNVTPLGRDTLKRESPRSELPAEMEMLTGAEFRTRYLLPLAESHELRDHIRTQARVLAIGRSTPSDPRKPSPFRLLIRDSQGIESFAAADVILDCTGTFARPNWVGDAGIPAAGELAARQHCTYWPEDLLGAKRAAYAGKSIIVIGAGYSAAGSVSDLATIGETDQSTWVIWLTNGPRSQPIPRITNDPLKDRDRLAVRANNLAARGDGNLEYHPQCVIDELVSHGPDAGFRVAARIAGKPMTWDVERVIANVGYRADLSISASLRVAEPSGTVETGEPGYYFLGSKSSGRDSNFLLRDGHNQIRGVFATITGKRGLDLYSKKTA